jgi:replication factor A1
MLSSGSISRILNGEKINPTLQVISIKQLNPGGSSGIRHRLILSDGVHYQPAMLATQKNELVLSGQMVDNSIITVQEFVMSNLQGKKVIIVLNLDVNQTSADRIGNPVGFETSEPLADASTPAPSTSFGQQSSSYGQQQQSFQQQQQPYGGNSYGQQPQQQPYQQQQQQQPYGGGYGQQQQSYGGGYGSSSSGFSSAPADDVPVFPISALNPYNNRWTIKARVTKKSDIKRWSNARGEGTLFSVDLLDEEGGEIRGTFFKDMCERYFPILQEGKVYYVSGGRLKVANKRYTSLNCEYEISFDNHTEIREAQDDARISTMKYSFCPIDQIAQTEPGAMVDILGVVSSFTEVADINSTKRPGEVLHKRDLTLFDQSGFDISLTLWGDMALQDGSSWANHPVLAVKGVRVSDYGGRSLGIMGSSHLAVNPPLPEAASLRQWAESQNFTPHTSSLSTGSSSSSSRGVPNDLSQRVNIADIKEQNLGFCPKPDYVSVKASINFIKSDPEPWYPACPNEGCNKKVVETMDGGWICEKCGGHTFDRCDRRFILSATAQDHTGQTWMTLFNDTALPLLNNTTAQQLYEFKQAGDPTYDHVFANSHFQAFLMRLRVKAEMVNDEQRVKLSVMRLEPLDYRQECRNLLDAIGKYRS